MAEKSKTTYVIDASFMLSYLLPDEKIRQIQEIFDQYKKGDAHFISITLLPFEVANALSATTLSHRIDAIVAKQLLDSFLDLPIILEQIDYSLAFDLAKKHNLSVYDASYLFLAQREDLMLLTLDKRLKKLCD